MLQSRTIERTSSNVSASSNSFVLSQSSVDSLRSVTRSLSNVDNMIDETSRTRLLLIDPQIDANMVILPTATLKKKCQLYQLGYFMLAQSASMLCGRLRHRRHALCRVPNCRDPLREHREERMKHHLRVLHPEYFAEFNDICDKLPTATPARVKRTRNDENCGDTANIARRNSSVQTVDLSSSSLPDVSCSTALSLSYSDTSFQSAGAARADDAEIWRQKVLRAFAEHLACTSGAHRQVELPSFKRFIAEIANALPQDYYPPSFTAYKMKQFQQDIAEQMRAEVVTSLTGRSVTVAVDGWKDTNGNNVINVILCQRGDAFYWSGVFMRTESEAGECVGAELISVFKALQQKSIRVVAIVTDNDAKIFAAQTFVQQWTDPMTGRRPFQHILNLRCVVHTLNLIVIDTINTDWAAGIMKDMGETVSLIKNTKALRQAIFVYQQKARHQYRVLEANDTRWNSQYTALARFVKLRKAIEYALNIDQADGQPPHERLSHHPTEWWEKAELLKGFLLPFLYANHLLQSDSASLHTANRMFDAIKDHVTVTAAAANALSQAAKAGKQKFENKKWAPLRNNSWARCFARLLMAQFLHGFDGCPQVTWIEQMAPAETFAGSVVDWYVHWGAQFIMSDSNTATSVTEALVRQRLKDQWISFHGRQPMWRRIYAQYNESLAQYREQTAAETTATVQDLGAVNFTVDTCEERAAEAALSTVYTSNEFVRVCRALLAIIPSEAAAERSFSAQKLVHTSLRNCLSWGTIDSEMVIRFNRAGLDRASCTELDENDNDYEPPMSYNGEMLTEPHD